MVRVNYVENVNHEQRTEARIEYHYLFLKWHIINNIIEIHVYAMITMLILTKYSILFLV